MSKRQSYNSIFFVTTLSVYLGLVLVGASPQILAQAALAGRFEIKDQLEKSDDLDKNPDSGLFASDDFLEAGEKEFFPLSSLEAFPADIFILERIRQFEAVVEKESPKEPEYLKRPPLPLNKDKVVFIRLPRGSIDSIS